MLVIADSSPLIYLSRVGALHVLPALFDEVAVPRAVWDETVERRPSAPGIDALHQASWLRVVDNPSLQLDLGLDPGETAAILLAESLRADLLLIDEKIGRKVARARGLSVRGTLGVLVQARQERLLPTQGCPATLSSVKPATPSSFPRPCPIPDDDDVIVAGPA